MVGCGGSKEGCTPGVEGVVVLASRALALHNRASMSR